MSALLSSRDDSVDGTALVRPPHRPTKPPIPCKFALPFMPNALIRQAPDFVMYQAVTIVDGWLVDF